MDAIKQPLDFAQWEREQRAFIAHSSATKVGIAKLRIRQHAQIYWKRRELEEAQEERFLSYPTSVSGQGAFGASLSAFDL
jgi:hypothetical protein